MKTLKSLITLPPFGLFGLMAVLLTGCIGRIECQSPPPSFFFQISSNGTVYPSTVTPSPKLIISYQDGGQEKTITDVQEINGYFDSGEIISRSWNLNNPEFTLKFDDKVVSKIRFKTYINNAKCQGWPTISEVYENDQLVQPTGKGSFVFGH